VRRVVSALLLAHIVAIMVGAFSPPGDSARQSSSLLEQSLRGIFAPYYQVIDQGYVYSYYAPEPPPTPVVTATIHFPGGRPEETVRLPRRETLPWLLRQRQLALAHHLFTDFRAAGPEGAGGTGSPWGRSYARHLAHTHPGCSAIVLTAQWHLIPEFQQVREILARPGSRGVDLDAESFYTVPERIGEYAP
jgi:hypothetical protein